MENPQYYLITGASSGVGYETALKLAAMDGTEVIALARSTDKLKDLRVASENRIHTITFDLETGDIETLVAQINAFGVLHLNGIIHNAGFLVNRPFEDITRDELERSYRINIFAPYLLTQSLLPLLRASNGGHIIHISSVGGIQGSVKFPGLSAYSSGKGALAVLTECLATELEKYKISVNCLALGAVQTEMLSLAFPGYEAPLKAHEMGEFISWFTVNGHKFFNGKILPVALSTP